MKPSRPNQAFLRRAKKPLRVYSTRLQRQHLRYHHSHRFVKPVLAPVLVPITSSSL